MKNRYVYGALNRLEEAVNSAGQTAKYQYHGLGHRVGKEIILDPTKQLSGQSQKPDSRIDYLIDLTREYHNLLEKTEDGISQTYFWDGNVAAFEESGKRSYYLQDELGSPLRIEDESGFTRETYGYGSFGEDLYGNQGVLQAFGYTGYQRDRVAGTYYAQAREYQAEVGRFAGQDLIAGFMDMPLSMNRYSYCFNMPMILMDLDGAWPEWVEDIGNSVKNWVNENVGITTVNEARTNSNLGIVGSYISNSTTVKSDKLINITMENGVPKSISLNLKGKIKKLEINSSIGIAKQGMQMTLGATWENEEKINHSVEMAFGNSGGFEWGRGKDNKVIGGGFRLNLNPLETVDIYGYESESSGKITQRFENGYFINSGVLEVAVIFVVIFGPEIISAMAETGVTVGLGTVGTAALLFLINKDIYDNFCEMG